MLKHAVHDSAFIYFSDSRNIGICWCRNLVNNMELIREKENVSWQRSADFIIMTVGIVVH